MKKVPFTIIFVLAFCALSFAQSGTCPTINVEGPSEIVKRGGTITYSVDTQTNAGMNLVYEWTVSSGKIIRGQGTSNIEVLVTEISSNGTLATVEIKGLPEGCPNGDSECSCGDLGPEAKKIDEFGKATNGNVKWRFDAFILELQRDPTAQGYILNYGSDREIAKRERQILNAVAFRKYDASRITMVRGGETDDVVVKTQFWIVPAGATPPTP